MDGSAKDCVRVTNIQSQVYLSVDRLDPATRLKMTRAGDSIFIPLGGCCCCKRGRDWPEVDRISSRPLHLGTIIKTRSSNTIVIILMMGTFTAFGAVIIMLKVLK